MVEYEAICESGWLWPGRAGTRSAKARTSGGEREQANFIGGNEALRTTERMFCR
jgi:hypothetical protein